MKKDLKVAIVHDYLHVFGGAEGVVQAIWELFPNADIYSATYDAGIMKEAKAFQGAKIHAPKWQKHLPGKLGRFIHLVLVANLPIYFDRLNLKSYDLVLSSSAHFAKGVRINSNQLHISYIHTPPRFLYGYEGALRKRSKWYVKVLLFPLDSILREIDKKFAQRPDYLLCNSKEVQKRIKKFYNRHATVINPFPNVTPGVVSRSSDTTGCYYLVVSRLSSYKNIDLCIETCGENNIPLKVAGTGEAEKDLKKLADKFDSVEMLGFVNEKKKEELFKNCKGFLCTVKDEDFGMVALEPMMYGKPVVALRQSGYLETVKEDINGVFFNELTRESLLAGIKKLESKKWDREKIKKSAQKFSKKQFQKEYLEFVEDKLKYKGLN